MKKKAFLLLLIIAFMISSFPVTMFSVSAVTVINEPTITIESKTTASKEQVKVNVNVSNNSGIAGAILKISYDSKLTLVDAVSGERFSRLSFTKPDKFENPSTFLWDSESGQITDDGTILTLIFDVSNEVMTNENLKISVSYSKGDIYDEELNDVDFKVVDGYISVKSYNIGDVNFDKNISITDVTAIQKHIVKIELLSSEALLLADANKDGMIDINDATVLQKFISRLIPSLDEIQKTTQNRYTVTFEDFDGSVIKTEKVSYGKSATVPFIPQRDGYVFLNWNRKFDYVTSDLVVTAQYQKITKPTIYVQSVEAYAGEIVQIPVKIYNNPGINGMQLNILYNENISLDNAEKGIALSTLFFTSSKVYASPSKFLWDGIDVNDSENGTALILTFNVPIDAKSGEEYMINAVYPIGSIYDSDLEDVNFDIINGMIKIK